MNDDNVVDITDRKELMGRMVESDAVKFVQIGTSGKNQCLVLSKTALIAIREGQSFPVEVLVGDTKMKFVIMRDRTFKKNLRDFKKTAQAAQGSVEATIEANNEAAKLGQDIGNNKIITD